MVSFYLIFLLMEHRILPASELVLNADGSVYHLHLINEHVADTVIIVGDQGRVEQISKHFDNIEYKLQNREFVTHTGIYRGTRITVISTGIGPDNIDIAINEIDAAVNIDLDTRTLKEEKRQLNIIRIGTSGALQEDVPVDSFVVSEFGLGLEGLIYYYDYKFDSEEVELNDKINEHLNWNPNLSKPYFVKGSFSLIGKIGHDMIKGVTATASGFYGPQGRKLRLKLDNITINELLTSFKFKDHRITNFEMETSALYGLGSLLGHNCCTVCAIIANRITNNYSENHIKVVDDLIITVLDRITKL